MVFDPSQGDGAQLLDIMQLQATLAGYSLVDPTEAELTPGSSDLTVDVAAAPSGVRLGGPAEDFDGEDGVGLPDPDPDDPRKALVYVDSDGDVQTLGGDPASPVPEGEERAGAGVPTVPIPGGDFLPLAEVWIPADAVDISESDISSRRVQSILTNDYNALENKLAVLDFGYKDVDALDDNVESGATNYLVDDDETTLLEDSSHFIEFQLSEKVGGLDSLKIRWRSTSGGIRVIVDGSEVESFGGTFGGTDTDFIDFAPLPPDTPVRVEADSDDFVSIEYCALRQRLSAPSPSN